LERGATVTRPNYRALNVLSCRQILGGLCDYVDGCVERDQRLKIEQHIAACDKCRIVCETTRQTVRIYREWRRETVFSVDVEERLLSAIEKRIGKCR
jgi:anti-sigma factor RsiW